MMKTTMRAVRVRAAAVLPVDCRIRRGEFAHSPHAELPYTPGTAFAGDVDYQSAAFETTVRDPEFVLDTIGGTVLQRLMQAVRRGGTVVSIVETPSQDVAHEYRIRAVKNRSRPTNAQLVTILELIRQGHVQPAIGRVFPIDEAPHAHRLCETGHGRGRIVLVMRDGEPSNDPA